MVRRNPGLQGLLFNTALQYERELVKVSKGGVVALDWYKPSFDVSKDPPPLSSESEPGTGDMEAPVTPTVQDSGATGATVSAVTGKTATGIPAPAGVHLRSSASAPCLADAADSNSSVVEISSSLKPSLLQRSPALARRAQPVAGAYGHSAALAAEAAARVPPPPRAAGGRGGAPDAPTASMSAQLRQWRRVLPASRRPVSPTARPVLLVLHGLTGGSQETYVQHCVAEAAEHGMQAVVMIARGCGGLSLTSPLCFSAALTEDVRVAVRRVQQRVGEDTPLFAIGFSLGASILAKYLCEEGADAPLVAAASCAASFDPRLSCSALEENSLYRVTYNRSMAHSLKAFYLRHREQFEKGGWYRGAAHHDEIMRAATVREFDTAATAAMHGFRSFVEYYDESTTSHRIAREIKVPYLILNAKDDPVCHAGGVPVEAALHNKNVVIGITEEGGHVAWCQGWMALGRYWAEQAAVEFFLSHLQERHADDEVRHGIELAAKREQAGQRSSEESGEEGRAEAGRARGAQQPLSAGSAGLAASLVSGSMPGASWGSSLLALG